MLLEVIMFQVSWKVGVKTLSQVQILLQQPFSIYLTAHQLFHSVSVIQGVFVDFSFFSYSLGPYCVEYLYLIQKNVLEKIVSSHIKYRIHEHTVHINKMKTKKLLCIFDCSNIHPFLITFRKKNWFPHLVTNTFF